MPFRKKYSELGRFASIIMSVFLVASPAVNNVSILLTLPVT